MASRSHTTARQGELTTAPTGAQIAPLPCNRPIRVSRGDDGQPIASPRRSTSAPALDPPITSLPGPLPSPDHPSLSSDHAPNHRIAEQRFHRSCRSSRLHPASPGSSAFSIKAKTLYAIALSGA